jgi:hypothetical protein
MLAANRHGKRNRIEFVSNVRWPWHGESGDPDPENPENWPSGEPHVGALEDCGATLMRFVFFPNGM